LAVASFSVDGVEKKKNSAAQAPPPFLLLLCAKTPLRQ
jgi:hypothetical protein